MKRKGAGEQRRKKRMQGQEGQARPPPNAVIFGILQAEWVSLCLKASVILRIPDYMQDTPQSFEDIAKAAGVDANNLHTVLRVLASNGVFSEHADGKYSHNVASKELVSGVRGNCCAMVKMMAHESHQKPWQPDYLVECIKAGQDAFRRAFPDDVNFWAYMDKRPSERALFWETMESTSTLWHTAIVTHYDFSNIKKLVDVGGGLTFFFVVISVL